MFGDIVIVLFILFFWTTGINSFFGRNKGLNKKDIIILKRLFIYHQIISIFFSFYVSRFGGDANLYWFVNNQHELNNAWLSYYGTGTTFLQFISYPLVKFLDISFYCGGLLFGFFGYLGFVYFYIIVRKFSKKSIVIYTFPIFPLLLFLPNLNFWSSGIGKDSLMFFGIMLFIYSLFNYKKSFFWCIIASLLIYHIRPPMVVFLIISTFIAAILDQKLKVSYKIFLAVVLIAGGIIVYNPVLASLKINNLNGDEIEQFSQSRVANLSKDSGSGVNTESYPVPLKIFTFLYRPLFFDINGPLAVVASFENFLLLYISIITLFKLKPFKVFKIAPFQVKALILFFIISSIAFSLTLGNLGIMLRMKIMIVPSLLIFIFWSVEYLRYERIKIYKQKIKAAIHY